MRMVGKSLGEGVKEEKKERATRQKGQRRVRWRCGLSRLRVRVVRASAPGEIGRQPQGRSVARALLRPPAAMVAGCRTAPRLGLMGAEPEWVQGQRAGRGASAAICFFATKKGAVGAVCGCAGGSFEPQNANLL